MALKYLHTMVRVKDLEASLAFYRLLGLEDDPPAPFLYLSDARRVLAAELTAGSGPILAMGPAANWIGKTWPVERFSQVAMTLLHG